MYLKRKTVVLTAVLAILSLLLTACGTSATSGEATTNSGTKTPQVGGNLVVGLTGDPYNLAPWVSNDMNASLMMNIALPNLMDTDDSGKKIPWIMKDYTVSDDAKVYTITIPDNLKWHDGVPFTTEDLAFTAKYLVDNKLGFGGDMYSGVEKIEIVDPTTIEYYLKKPQVNFLSQIGFWVPIMPKHIYENVDDPMNFQFNGVGYGPYKLKEYKKGEYYTFERVPDWPLANEGKGAYLDTITFRVFSDANALILAMKNGEINVSGSSIPVASQKQLEASGEQFGVERVNSLGYGYFGFSYKNELLQDFNVRKAIAMTIDRDALVNTAIQGGAVKMETPISPVFKDLVKSDIKFPGFDIEGAKKVLKDAGYADKDNDGVLEAPTGKKLEFDLIYRTTTANIDAIANIFKANAEEAGFKINLKAVDPATYTDKVVKQHNFDINVIDWGTIDDADSSLGTIYLSSAALNFMDYKNDKIDDLISKSEVEPNYEKRVELMNEFQKEYVNELPTVNTWVRVNAYGYSKNFEGWGLAPGNLGLLNSKYIVNVYKVK
ncbi:MAG TPA: ABC transporter substrate-binding protein [Desulfitobacterium dehalogenans]|uniref:ABC transporter substrate-binding protein n=1 Tax=Desulfitobacterium dehalogenans TaxID=36854 RepID=A0A7C6Z4R2_9FIRM|nr:ABC transporter substrate-binding protein [Desulfitobacterium dehalogenans]